jgi:DNA replication licensing factor MCM4
MAVNEMFFERYPAAVLDHQIQVRPFNAQKTKNMRSLNPEGGFPYMSVNKSDTS